MKIKKGDVVKVMTGADKGKTGRVIKVLRTRDRLMVEGVNLVKKHTRPTQENPQGGIVEKESTIHISNVQLFVNGEATRVGYKTLDDGKKVRISKSTGEVID
jgi:large subunit ribosomal protein L24